MTKPNDNYNLPTKLLQNIVFSHQETFVSRYSIAMKEAGLTDLNLFIDEIKSATNQFCKISISVEFLVLLQYLNCVSFIQMGLNEDECKLLCVELFYDWICYQTLLNTYQNNGHVTGVIYLADGSGIKADSDTFYRFFKNLDGIWDRGTVAE